MKYILPLCCLLFLYSCGSSPTVKTTQTPESSESDFQLAPGYYFGEVAEHIPQNKMEETLLNQVADYNSLLCNSDFKKFKKYIYMDAIIYMAKHFPNSYTNDQIISALYGVINQKIGGKPVGQVIKDKGVRFIVSYVGNPVREGRKILVNFDIQVNVTGNGKKIHSEPDKTIGISLNNGANWTFIHSTQDSKEILQKRFKEETINKLLNTY